MKRIISIVFLAICALGAQAQVVLDQVDTFTDGTTQFWSSGANPINVPSGGPAGATDAYLQFAGTGEFGAGGTPAIVNSLQWSGNYNAQGVKIVRMNMRNFSSIGLTMRLVFTAPLGSKWTSHPGFSLPGNSGWLTATFFLTTSAMVQIGGSETLSAALAGAGQLQLRNDSDPPGPANGGTQAAATVGVDNISALATLNTDAFSFTVDSGLFFGGNLNSLRQSDNDSVIVLNDDFDPNTLISFTTTKPTTLPVAFNTPSKIRIRRETAASRSDLSEFLRAFNYSTNAWNNVGFRVPGIVDSVVNVDITANVGNYIQAGSGESKAQLFYVPNADVDAADGWTERCDEIEWQFYP